jgi:hypothetical protein
MWYTYVLVVKRPSLGLAFDEILGIMKKEEIRSQSYDRELQRHRCKNLQRHEFLFGSTTLLTRTTGNSLRMQWPLTSQLHGSVSQRDQTPRPYPTRSLPAQLWHRCTEWSTVWVSTKPLITEENWPGWGLNPGLPNDTPALYPLLHELML